MPNKILQRVQRLLEKGQCQGFPIPIWTDWSLLTLLHPGEVSSSLASPHGNSRSSSENRLSRRQRWQQLLQSFPGRRLYSASLAPSKLCIAQSSTVEQISQFICELLFCAFLCSHIYSLALRLCCRTLISLKRKRPTSFLLEMGAVSFQCCKNMHQII